jgi:glycosyltransferase involved in cell wall biosynthesis
VRSGSTRNPRVLLDAMRLPGRLAHAATSACRDLGCDRAILYGHAWIGLHQVVAALSRAGIPMAADMNEWWLWDLKLATVVLDQAMFRRFCLPKIHAIVGISSFWEDYARRIGKQCILIPAMADDEFAELPPPSFHPFSLVYAGFLFRRDLPDTLLEGVKRAVARGSDVRLVTIGRMNLYAESRAAVRRIEADPALRARTRVTGWVERDELHRIYAQASAFVLLRNDDWEARVSFPTRVPEYLATGRPLITSRAGDIGRYLRDRCNACLLDPGDRPDQLADAIGRLSSDPASAQRLGASGQMAAAGFSYRLHGRRLREFMDAW